MNPTVPERTSLIIAVEINSIKDQTEKLVLHNFIEIGRRLHEAKALLPHGEWLQWLEESVDFSPNRAAKLMRLYDAYGLPHSSLLDSDAQDQVLSKLSYTQALILLGVPEEERTQLILDLDIESMSTRELKKAVDKQKQIQQEKEQADQENTALRQALDGVKEENTELAKERDSLKQEAVELRKTQQALQENVEKATLQNKKLKENMNYKSYQRVRNDLAAAQTKLFTSQVAFKYEALERAFKELSYELDLLANLDAQVHAGYMSKLNDFLLKAMRGRMQG